MPRVPRNYSQTKVYHIILKGIDNQKIFFSNQDRKFFLKQLSITKNEFYYQIFAYCLMDNHVHIIIRVEDEFLSKSMQSLSIRYAHYFNSKYKRVGPLFQSRFKSKNIEDERYFLEVCRYVHRNPENSRISKTEDYEWSSYKEYVGKTRIITRNTLMSFFNTKKEEFIKYTTQCNEKDMNDFTEYEIIQKLTDDQLFYIIKEEFDIPSDCNIYSYFKSKDNKEIGEVISKIKKINGTNKTQVSRVTGIYKGRIDKIW